MADSFGGFSIREYASRMRSEDMAKCWPFSRGSSDNAIAREVAESLLPPMSVAKFRWWSRELEIARSTRNDLDAPSRGANDARDFVSRGSSSLEEPRPSAGEPPRSEIITFDCPVCGVLTAATVNAVNAHVDSCLARQEEKRQMKAKAKSRAPKKRSIVEIFAMSPQVQRVSGGEDSPIVEDEEEEEEEEEERREDKSRHRATDAVNLRKKQVKKKKNTVWARVSAVGKIHKKKNKNKNKKNKKKKKKLKKISGNGSINKESSPKLRRKIASHLSRNVNYLCNEKNKNDILDSASIDKEKPSLKSLSSPKKHKAMAPCKSIAKRLKPEYPVRGILKKRARSYSGQESTVCNRQSSAHVNSQTALVEKHVRFLIKDDKSGTQAKSNLQASLQQPGMHAGYTDEDHGQLIGRGGDLVQVIGAGDNLSDSGKDGTEDQAITGKGQLPDTCHHTDIRSHVRPQASCQNIVNLSEESNSPSQITRVSHEHLKMYGQMKLAADNSPRNVDYCTFQEAVNGRAASCSNVSVASSAFRPENSGTELMKCFVGASHDFCGKKPQAMAVTRSSSSCFAINGSLSGRLSMSSVEDAADYAVLKQPLCSLPPRNLSGNLSHSPEWSERIISLTGKPMDEDFLGLPLNSHGELIQLNSSGSMHAQVKKWDMIPGSSNFLPNESLIQSRNTGDSSRLKENRFVERACEKDQLNLFPMENFSVENSRLSLLSNQGGMESQDTTRADVFWQNSERHSSSAYLLDADINRTNIPVNACRQYDLFENQKGKGVIYFKENADHVLPTTTPVTMRLMGKDVAVGRSCRETHGSEDGKIWTDKQIIIEHQPSSSLKNSFSENNPFLHDWSAYSAPRKPKGTLHPSFESQNAFHLRYPQKAPESLVSNPHIGWQSEVVLPDGKVSAQRNPYFEHQPFSHHPYSPLVFQLTNLPEPFMVGAETLRADSQLASRSISHQSCQQMNRGPELKNQQSLPHPKTSAPTVPFLSPDFREHKQIAQQWQLPSSRKELPPWFTFSCPAPDSREPTPLQLKSLSKDLSLWRPISNASEWGSAPSPQYQSFCDRGSIHHSYGTPANNFFSTPHMHYPPVTSFPYNTMASQVDNPLVVSPIACPRPPFVPVLPWSKPTSAVSMSYRNGTDSGGGTRSKSFGVKIPGFCKKTKNRPAVRVDDLQKHGKPNLKLQRHGVGLPVPREHPSLELDSNGERACSTVCLQDGIQKDGLMSLLGGQSFKLTEAAKPGPTKLSAGAKHILKPSKNVDQDNSMPIHSTIPFAGVTMVPESQVKSAKIYKF